MTESYFVLGGLLVSICLLMGWMFIWSHVHYAIKAVTAATVVGASIYIWVLLTAVMGYPVHKFPTDGGVIIAFRLDKPAGAIYLWIDGQPPRAFAIPYNEKTAEGLVEGQGRAQRENGRMIYHAGKGHKGDGGDDDDAEGDADGAARRGHGHGARHGRGGFGFFNDDSENPPTVEVQPNLPPKE